MKHLPPKLNEVYNKHYSNGSKPGFQELQDIFLATVQQFTSVFLVLDALDECTLDQRADLCDFFARVVELSPAPSYEPQRQHRDRPRSHGLVKLFVASRKERDIESAFLQNSFPKVEVEAKKVDSDIELYIKAQIEQRLSNGSLTLNNMMLKDKILTALTAKAGGMYVFPTVSPFHYLIYKFILNF